MKSTALLVAAAAMMFAPSAYAREHNDRHRHHDHFARHRVYARSHSGRTLERDSDWTSGGLAYSTRPTYSGRDRRRPATWCGWEMRRLVGNDPGPSFNLAPNWARWGRPGPAGSAPLSSAQHVGKIAGRENGQWLVESGNDGHAVRTRPRSVAGAIAIRWG